jgi:hypothetical protein
MKKRKLKCHVADCQCLGFSHNKDGLWSCRKHFDAFRDWSAINKRRTRVRDYKAEYQRRKEKNANRQHDMRNH